MVVLNKVDLIDSGKKENFINNKKLSLKKLFQKTNYKNSQSVPIIEFSCKNMEQLDTMKSNFIENILKIIDSKGVVA